MDFNKEMHEIFNKWKNKYKACYKIAPTAYHAFRAGFLISRLKRISPDIEEAEEQCKRNKK